MLDVTLKITKYVIFILNQIASSARFPGRQVVSSTKDLKPCMGAGERQNTEDIPSTEVPGPRELGQGHHCEVLQEVPLPTTLRQIHKGSWEGWPLREDCLGNGEWRTWTMGGEESS